MPERPKGDKSDAPQLSRLEKMRKDRGDESYEPEMPPVEVGAHLLGYLFEVGPTMPAGMASGPVTHEELRAWQDNMGVELKPWETKFLRRLSFDYLAQIAKAEKPDCPSPWSADGAEQARTAVALSMRDAVRRLAQM